MNVITEEVVTDNEAKEVLERREKETELKYEQKNALEHLRKFVKTDSEKIKGLVEELKKIERLRDKQIVTIAAFLPENKDELKVILHKDYTSFPAEEINSILEKVKKF